MFKKGQSVRVKANTQDYNNPNFQISGWQGRIVDIDKEGNDTFIEVQWDSITLLAMPDEYVEESINEDLEYENYVLDSNDLELCMPRDTEADVHSAQAEIDKRYFEEDNWSEEDN